MDRNLEQLHTFNLYSIFLSTYTPYNTNIINIPALIYYSELHKNDQLCNMPYII